MLNGGGAPRDFYAAWEGRGGKVEYSRFRIYRISYAISVASAVTIAAVYLIIGKVSRKGTKRTGLKISVINEFKRHTELNLEKKNMIKKAIEDKQKVKKRPDSTALLVYFDDYIAYSQDEDRKKMNKFLD